VRAAEPIDNIVVSRQEDRASIRIVTSCRTTYASHTPAESGVELRLTLEPEAGCESVEPNGARTYRPAGRELGRVEDVQVDFAADGNWYLTLRFASPVRYTVQPHPAGWLEVEVEIDAAAATPVAASRPPPLAEPSVATRSYTLPVEHRAVGRAGQSTPLFGSDVPVEETYVVQLGVFAAPDQAKAALSAADVSGFAYTTVIRLGDKDWHALQVGFYDTEDAATGVLAQLSGVFPDAWVRLVEDSERAAAERDGAIDARGGALAVSPRPGAAAGDDELNALMAEGQAAILERRYDDAIESYTGVLEVAAHTYRAEAREHIGVALERSGRTDEAIAEYRAWLTEFANDPGSARVEERLRGLTETVTISRTPTSDIPRRPETGWQIYGGVSQYYWRNQEQLVDEGNYLVSSSGILSLADVTATRAGTRFDLQARLNGAYQVDLIEYDGNDNTGWITNAYVDAADKQTGVRGRLGRQSRYQDGVIGRFDGAAVDYELTQGIGLGFSAGMPIDSPRYNPGAHRTHLAASARFDDLWRGAGLNVFVQQQTVDGIADRQAIGGEVRARIADVALFSTLDYDLSYGTVNLALVNAQWLMESGWTLNLRAETGVAPFITTRNALAGQGVASIEDLLDTYTEDEIRVLAEDRTGTAQRLSAALALPLSERFDLSLDAAVRRFGGTRESGGVAAIPASGSETYFAATLISTALFSSDDLNSLSLRHDASYTRDKLSLYLDSRLRLGSHLRLRPSLTVSQLDYRSPAASELVVEPAIRLMYRWHRILIDAEAGIRHAERENPARAWDPFSPDGQEQLTGVYLNLGYQMEF
jgi:tetratricopeptide (TPR) repeat protein